MIKRVGYAYYVHKSNVNELLHSVSTIDREIIIRVIDSVRMYLFIDFDIVKFDSKTKNVSLIQCPTWDILNEPIVGDSYCFHSDLSYKVIKGGTKVYHNKWQFVSENYKGFDIEKSKSRTKEWNSISGVDKLKSKIGNIVFWYSLLEENHLEI